MRYSINKRDGSKMSALGFGCMRMTRKGGSIDHKKFERELSLAVELGVNYFDTAYVYPGSEDALGRFIAKISRDKLSIASKLPHYKVKSSSDFDRFFDEQKRRLRTDRIDYYLMHMLNDSSSWERLKNLGIEEWLERKKRIGEIGFAGFSYHGGADSFSGVVDAYDWDFCQIQYNYVDENTQAGTRGLNYAASKGLDVIVMEPLRGGRLTYKLPTAAKKLIEGTGRSAAEWGLRWLWDKPAVSVVLSGMNSDEMIRENCRIASASAPGCVAPGEEAFYTKLRSAVLTGISVPCTGCGYCMPCPHGVDIPVCFSAFNTLRSEGRAAAMTEYVMTTSLRPVPTVASRCVGCGRCEPLCPQQIQIREELKAAAGALETPVYRVITAGAKLLGYRR